jgi:predicted PurR-regulated permease PerM
MKLAITAVAVFLIIRYWGSVESFVGLLLGGMLAIFAGLVISYIVNIPLRFFERKLPGPTGDGTRTARCPSRCPSSARSRCSCSWECS